MLDEIKADLGANYIAEDDAVLQSILDNTITNALFISNRSNNQENIEFLKPEIVQSVKNEYLRRGSEDVKSLSQSGLSSTYQDPMELLRQNIVKNGKRLIR